MGNFKLKTRTSWIRVDARIRVGRVIGFGVRPWDVTSVDEYSLNVLSTDGRVIGFGVDDGLGIVISSASALKFTIPLVGSTLECDLGPLPNMSWRVNR